MINNRPSTDELLTIFRPISKVDDFEMTTPIY